MLFRLSIEQSPVMLSSGIVSIANVYNLFNVLLNGRWLFNPLNVFYATNVHYSHMNIIVFMILSYLCAV